MSAVEIEGVGLAAPLRAGGGAFDLPRPGSTPLSFRVAMWFRRPADEPLGKVDLSLAASPQSEAAQWELRSAPVSPRGDVPVEQGKVALGFDAYVDGIDLGEQFAIVVTYLPPGGEPIELGRVRGRRPGNRSAPPKFLPALVCSQGRTGSTALMRALLPHPACVLNPRYPYEDAPGSHWARVAATFLRTADLNFRGDPLMNDLGVIRRTWRFVRPSRYLHVDYRFHQEIEALQAAQLAPVSDFARAGIDRTYQQIARASGKHDSGRFFVEKNMWRAHTVNELLWFHGTVKLVVVTREPLDAFRSAREFNSKRGFLSFGRESCPDEQTWLDVFSERTAGLADLYAMHPPTDRLCVRFEDLVRDPPGELGRLGAFLGPPLGGPHLAAMVAAFARRDEESLSHRTREPGDEVGAWRSQLAAWEVQRILERTSDYRRCFGYEAS